MRLFVLVSLLVAALGVVAYVVDNNVRTANAEIAAEQAAKAAAEAAEREARIAEQVAAIDVKIEAATTLLQSEEQALENVVREGGINRANAASLRKEAEKIATELAEFKAEAERKIAVSEQQIVELNESARTRDGYAADYAVKAAEAKKLVDEFRTTVEQLQHERTALTR
jgi:hypothetical protein